MPWKMEEKMLTDSTEHETRHTFFCRRLKELDMYDNDSDYEGMIGKAVEELSDTFSKQGHSGMSAQVTIALFLALMQEWNNGGV